jgi:CBS domain-containing protein
MLAQDIMTAPVITISPTASIAVVANLMLAHHISGVPVTTANGTLVGMITEGDFLRRQELGTERRRSRWLEFLLSSGKAADEYVLSHGRNVEEVMSANVAFIRPDATLDEIVTQMIDRKVKRLPVVANDRVVGIVSRSDLLRALSEKLPSGAVARSDLELRDAIVAELSRQSWSAHGSIHVEVGGGVATLSGVIFDERERLAARVAVENVTGVKDVIDELTWVDPMSGMTLSPPERAGNDGTSVVSAK